MKINQKAEITSEKLDVCKYNYDAYLEQNVYDENVEHIFEWVDDTVEHSLEFWHSLDGLEGSENTQHPKGLDGAQILTCGAPPVDNSVKNNYWKQGFF